MPWRSLLNYKFYVLLSFVLGALVGYQFHVESISFERQLAQRTIYLADVRVPLSGLLYLANHNNYFLEQGYSVVMKPTTWGRYALDEVIKGSADLGTVADSPLVKAVLEKKSFALIATIGNGLKQNSVIAYNRALSRPQDLVGKRIGIITDTNTEYFLHVFLNHHQIPENSVTIVPQTPHELIENILQRKIDAVAASGPQIAAIRQGLGDEATYFYGEDFFNTNWNLVASTKLANDPKKMSAILHGLQLAKDYLDEHPIESQRIVANYSGLDERVLAESWKLLSLDITLEQTILMSLERQAKWMLSRNLPQLSLNSLPNFLDYILVEPLAQENPMKVSIIR